LYSSKLSSTKVLAAKGSLGAAFKRGIAFERNPLALAVRSCPAVLCIPNELRSNPAWTHSGNALSFAIVAISSVNRSAAK
jgi:hypothetical protein